MPLTSGRKKALQKACSSSRHVYGLVIQSCSTPGRPQYASKCNCFCQKHLADARAAGYHKELPAQSALRLTLLSCWLALRSICCTLTVCSCLQWTYTNWRALLFRQLLIHEELPQLPVDHYSQRPLLCKTHVHNPELSRRHV